MFGSREVSEHSLNCVALHCGNSSSIGPHGFLAHKKLYKNQLAFGIFELKISWRSGCLTKKNDLARTIFSHGNALKGRSAAA